MALTSNKNIQFRNLSVAAYDSLPVSASTTIYQSAIVGVVTANSNVVHASNASTITGVGVAAQYVDNGDGASGDKFVNVYTSGEFVLNTTGSVSYGDALYVNSDEKLAASGSLASNLVFIGHCMEQHSGSHYWVRLDGPKKTGGTSY